MYHCKLKVHLFSKNAHLLKVLEECCVPERFSCEYYLNTYPVPCGSGNIIVWDLEEQCTAKSEEGCPLVLCREKECIAGMSSAELAEPYELWEKPLSPAYTAYRYTRLLERLKEKKDFGLCQKWLDTTIDSIPDLVWYKDVIGSHLKVNDAFCQTVGKTKKQIEGRGHYYIWDLKQEDYEKGEYVCLETEEEVLKAKKTCLFDEKVLGKMGLRQFKTYKSPVFDDDGEVIGTIGIAHDVTDLQNIATELNIILSSMPFAVLVTDVDGKIIEANDKFCQFFNVGNSAMLGKDYTTWREDAFLKANNGTEHDLCVESAETGEIRTLEEKIERIHDVFDTLVGYFYIYQDVTIERAYQHQMLHNAHTDFLTGLYNRRYFEGYAEEKLEPGLGILCLDLDNFKYVNDTYGHPVGDKALSTAAQALRRSCAHGLIARLGGDEFLVAFWNMDNEEILRQQAQEILEAVNASFSYAKQMNTLSTSIGAALFSPGMSLEELIRRSDVALYTAKGQGKSRCCVYQPGMETADSAQSKANLTAAEA